MCWSMISIESTTFLVNAIINLCNLFGFYFYRISKTEFERLSELIVAVFPAEKKGIYFTPAYKQDQAQGKLYSAYLNYRTNLREAKLIATRRKRSATAGKTLFCVRI